MSDFTIDTKNPLLVTGATGYIAGVLIKQLLDAGALVHATVRDTTKTDRFQYLQDIADNSPGSIKFFSADLLKPGSFKDAMEGCSVVFHTASPFIFNIKDPQKDLVDPAVKGTENVLNTACDIPTVKNVVLTSSNAAVYTDAYERFSLPNNAFTEEVWNRTASLNYQPYFFSKAMAEKAAWVIAGSQTQWKLVTVLPSFVLGPGVKYHPTAESYKTVVRLGGGEMKSGAPKLGLATVDVRDVAIAHIMCAFNPHASGRYLCVATNSSYYGIAESLAKKYSPKEYPIPTFTVPKFLLWLLAPYVFTFKNSRKWVANNCNIETNFDNSKIVNELGIKFRSQEESVQDMYAQLLDLGVVKTNN